MGALLVSCILALGGCNRTQTEDGSSVLVSGNGERMYEMAQAQRGNIQKTKVIVANYQQVKSENLSFSVDGRRLSAVYVSMGDAVKKGDLLMELYCDEEKEYLAALEYEIRTREMKIEHLREQADLELAQLARKKGTMSPQEYNSRVEEIEKECRLETEDEEDRIYIAKMEYEDLYLWLEGCKIYAGMDGVITYLPDTGSSFVSWGGNKVVTVSDSAECAFLSKEIEYASYFTLGETYVFSTSTGVEYKTTLTEIDREEGVLRFELAVPQYDLLGQRVLYSLVLEEKADALALPKNAVHYAGDGAYVYYFDEAGNRQMKQVTVGLEADSKVEILEGVAEGEEVILR